MSILFHDRIAEAWQDQKSWVEQDLPNSLRTVAIGDIARSATLLICHTLNHPATGGGAAWSTGNPGSVTLTNLKITQASGASIQPAVFTGVPVHDPASWTALLPVQFSMLEVQGQYQFSQGCVNTYDHSNVVAVNGSGNIVELLTNAKIVYVASLSEGASPSMRLARVEVHGTPIISLAPDRPESRWEEVLGFLTQDHDTGTLQRAMQNVFQTNAIADQLFSLLNSRIQAEAASA